MKLCFSPLASSFLLALATAAISAPLRPHGSPSAQPWASSFSFGGEVPEVGDFDGDGLDDIITFYRSYYPGSQIGDAMVSLNSGGSFGAASLWHPFFGINDETVRTGDFNGDGRDDIATFLHGTGGIVYVAISNGSGFNTASVWATGIATGKLIPIVGDFTGDGRADIASFEESTGKVDVFTSTGSGFVSAGRWIDDLGVDVAVSGDFDGDGDDDLGGLSGAGGLGTASVALSSGSGFDAIEVWATDLLFDFNSEVLSADFTADGRDDLALVSHLGSLWVTPSEGDSFHHDPTAVVWNSRIRQGGQICLPGHFNRDLNADLVVFVSGGNNGDVNVSLTGAHATPDPIDPDVFGYGRMATEWGIFPPVPERPALQEIPLVLGIFKFGDRPEFGMPLGRDTAFFDDLYFGPGAPNLRDWFLEMSKGRFTFSRAGVFTIEMDKVPPGDANFAMVQAMADAGFDFGAYDSDGDGNVEIQELCIAVVSNFDSGDGRTVGMITEIEYPSAPSVQLLTRVAGAGHLGPLDLYAHEVAHLFVTVDLYSSDSYNDRATLMHGNAFAPVSNLLHLDAWHKMRLGWERPIVYDLRDGPAAAVLDAAQLGARPPILVYDSEQGTDQYFLFEYRSPDCTLGAQIWDDQGDAFLRPNPPPGGYAAAGYDADVFKRGVAPWFASMGHPDHHNRQQVGIDKGAGGVLDATPAGDDVLSGDKILPGPDQILQTVVFQNIHAGGNQVLESVRAGDDILTSNRILPGPDGLFSTILAGDDGLDLADDYMWDELVYLAHDPFPLTDRGSPDYIVGNNEIADLKWLGAGNDFQLATRLNSANTSTIGWGGPFRPFMESWPTTPIRAGAPFTVLGKMGPSLASFKAVLTCDATGQSYELSKDAWSATLGVFDLPDDVPPGAYVFHVESSDAHSKVVSNTIPLVVEDTYGLWLVANFSPAEIADPSISGPQVDLDGDGLPTVGEFVAGGDPRVFEPLLRPWALQIDDRIYFRVPLLKDIPGVIVEIEYSENLSSWRRRFPTFTFPDYLGDPDLAIYQRSWPVGQRMFFRLRYTLVER